MPARSPSKVLRALIIPIGSVVGGFAAPALLMPSADELLRHGQFVDGTGYGSARIFGLIGGALVAYIIRTILDHTLWWSPKDADGDRSA